LSGVNEVLFDGRTTLRLKKKWLVYGGIIGIVATLISLGIVQAKQMSEKNSLSDELDMAAQDLSILEAAQSSFGQDGLDTQEDEAQTNYNIASAQLSEPIDSIIANESLFNIAAASSVTLTSISVSPLDDDALAELPCSYLPLNVTAEGNETALLDFISRLNIELTNGLVRSATLNIQETPAEGESTVDIELVIYTYQGE
jgi:hypothetical protein